MYIVPALPIQALTIGGVRKLDFWTEIHSNLNIPCRSAKYVVRYEIRNATSAAEMVECNKYDNELLQ